MMVAATAVATPRTTSASDELVSNPKNPNDPNDQRSCSDESEQGLRSTAAPPALDEESNPIIINNNNSESGKKRKRPTASLLKNAMEELDRIWGFGNSNGNDEARGELIGSNANAPHEIPPSDIDRVRQTTALLVGVFRDQIHEPAIRALVANEKLQDSQTKLRNELELSRKEAERLRRSGKRSKEAIENLLKAVGESAEETKDHSQSKLVEAKMRADLLHARAERDASHKNVLVANRSLELANGDLENLRNEKTTLRKDKLRLEKEVRAARSLADGLSSSLLSSDHHKDDLDYYKGKVKEYESHLQGMTAKLAEKNKEIRELHRCKDKNLSQQKLEALRAAGEPSVGTSGTNPDWRRRSY